MTYGSYESFKHTNVIFKVIQDRWRYHSIGHLWFPVSIPAVSVFYCFRDVVNYLPKFKDSRTSSVSCMQLCLDIETGWIRLHVHVQNAIWDGLRPCQSVKELRRSKDQQYLLGTGRADKQLRRRVVRLPEGLQNLLPTTSGRHTAAQKAGLYDEIVYVSHYYCLGYR